MPRARYVLAKSNTHTEPLSSEVVPVPAHPTAAHRPPTARPPPATARRRPLPPVATASRRYRHLFLLCAGALLPKPNDAPRHRRHHHGHPWRAHLLTRQGKGRSHPRMKVRRAAQTELCSSAMLALYIYVTAVWLSHGWSERINGPTERSRCHNTYGVFLVGICVAGLVHYYIRTLLYTGTNTSPSRC